MKLIAAGLLLIGLIGTVPVMAQIENLIVETYYISDVNDATDSIGGNLEEGSVTYRIYLDLAEGNTLKCIYGSKNHALKITGSENFFNNKFRGKSFGYQINANNLDNNTIALDSWLTMGFASNKHIGILKSEDPDTSMVGGKNNDGGSEDIPGGLLANDDPAAGIPLTTADGMVKTDSSATGFFENGFLSVSGDDSTLFGSLSDDTSFISYDARLFNNKGIQGPTPANKILIAQLTTRGTLSFELNVEIEKSDGQIINYVATETTTEIDTFYSSWLKYPFACGCMDPNYLEYSKFASCDDGSCATPIVFGCTDPAACNYNPSANWNIPELCCYNSECALNLDIVCPGTIYGCMDPNSYNYNPNANATSDIDTCCYIAGCMDSRYLEYNPDACYDDGSYCRVLKIEGCMEFSACNYNPFATIAKPDDCDFGCSEESEKISGKNSPGEHNGTPFEYEIFPNPVTDFMSLIITTPETTAVYFTICDMYGRQINNYCSGTISGVYNDMIDLSGIPEGIYLFKLYADGVFSARTIIKK